MGRPNIFVIFSFSSQNIFVLNMAVFRTCTKLLKPLVSNGQFVSSIPKRCSSYFPIDDSLYNLTADQKQVSQSRFIFTCVDVSELFFIHEIGALNITPNFIIRRNAVFTIGVQCTFCAKAAPMVIS